jgi:hypothetical protein
VLLLKMFPFFAVTPCFDGTFCFKAMAIERGPVGRPFLLVLLLLLRCDIRAAALHFSLAISLRLFPAVFRALLSAFQANGILIGRGNRLIPWQIPSSTRRRRSPELAAFGCLEVSRKARKLGRQRARLFDAS